LNKIIESGRITVITRNSAHSYYTYREKPMGFEYDLASAFANYLGVELDVITPGWDEMVPLLNEQKGDFIAASLAITPPRKKAMDFCKQYMEIQQMVILHKDNQTVGNLEDLKGKTIHVRRGSAYEIRLNELKKEGLDITIQAHDEIPAEELIRRVARRKIEVTVAHSHIALLNRRYYPDIRVAFPIEKAQYLAWGVKKGEKALLRKINNFFHLIMVNGTFRNIYDGYFANVEPFDYFDVKKYHQRLDTRLPLYEALIKKAADKHGLDWRLVAAVMYQESHFDPLATSFTGVRGIMQLTEVTADEVGVTDRLNPKESILGGVEYLRKLYDRYDGIEERDRILIALAAYNVGHGHVVDAQEIAREQGLDPNKWSSLQQTLPLLRYPKYYRKSKYGYCRGTEPVRYVIRILTYYDILKREAIRPSAFLGYEFQYTG
ncbi:MAG: membrane-bound lytic murein transglycosylase MltF, partial [Pseudomonadota bacterium]